MKKTFILLSLLVLVFSANVFAQKKMSPKQLFMLIPNDFVVGTAKERAKTLSLQASVATSSKNDSFTFFMSGETVPKMFAGDLKEPEGLCFLRVFRGKSSTIVGLRYQIGDSKEENPTVDKVKITTILLQYKDGKWTNVTDAMLPKVSVEEAHKLLSEDFQMKDVKKEDVWIEHQVNEFHKGIMTAARIKGNDSITTLKFFKWTGKAFVESDFELANK